MIKRSQFIIVVLVVISFIRCSNNSSQAPYSSYEEIIFGIDTDSIKNMNAICRQIDYMAIEYYGPEGNPILPGYLYLMKKCNKTYLYYNDAQDFNSKVRIRLDKYDRFKLKPILDSAGLDIKKIRYIHGIMEKHPIRSISYNNIYDTSIVEFDTMSYYYVRDTGYLNRPELTLENIDGKWYKKSS